MSGSVHPPPPPDQPPAGSQVPPEPLYVPPPPPGPPRRSGNRMLVFMLLGCGGLVALTVITGFVFIVWLGYRAPDTAIVPGPQVPQRFMNTIRETGVLDEGEEVLFFYSDALSDITDGFYLLTDQKVVLYSTQWETPAILVPFDEIAEIDVEYNKSFFEDSMVYLELADGSLVTVPASSDYDRDELFFETLEEKWLEATGGAADTQ